MKRNYFLLIGLLLFCLSCEEDGEPEFYHSRFYPVHKGEYNNWIKSSFFYDIPISLRLESRLDYKDIESSKEGMFEEVVNESVFVYSDRDIYYAFDTIKKQTNIMETSIAEIELFKVERGGGYVEDSYIIWLNKNNSTDFQNNSGYYTFHISAKTKNGYEINDSTIIIIK